MKLMFKKILICSLFLLLSFKPFAQSNGFEYIKSMELMELIYQNLDMYFVDEPKPGQMSKTAIDAMLRELDPYTQYYHESDMEDYRLMTTGQYGGIGSLIRKIGDYIYIAEPYEGNPAQKSGLLAGDKILSIDGKDMYKKNSEEVSSALKGPKGTTIEVKVLRNKTEEKIIRIQRDEIKLPDVPFSGMIDAKTGYIKLNSFTASASSDVKKAFVELKAKGMEKLVLDLRGNGGGLLNESVRIVNIFVKKGEIVVTTKGRIQEENRVYSTQEEPLDVKIPLVVLIDDYSASASEIVAGSLQDLDRAVIIGKRSFGKGLVQRTFDLKYGSKMKLTIAKYYTPSGRCVQKLEYYNKEDGAKAGEIPDSLIKIFKTRNGREVIDSRGVDPDIEIETPDFSRLTAMLVYNNLIFDYASDYYFSHPKIDSAGVFSLNDTDYAAFKAMVIKDTFDYSTASEEMLKRMRKTAEEEGYYDDVKAEYEALMSRVTPSKERDLEKFKTEIKEVLENEIISRYYYQRGRVIDAFRYDNSLIEAKKVLNDLKQYNTILKN